MCILMVDRLKRSLEVRRNAEIYQSEVITLFRVFELCSRYIWSAS